MLSERAPTARRRLLRQAGTYVVVGLANTGLSIALLWLLYGLGWPYPVYTAVAYGIMILISFELNRRFTFAARTTSKRQWRRRLVRFFILHLINLALIQSVQALLIEGVRLPQSIGVSAGLAIGLVVGFIGSKWVFENDRRGISACGIKRCTSIER
jgi:putative flippase GtrA